MPKLKLKRKSRAKAIMETTSPNLILPRRLKRIFCKASLTAIIKANITDLYKFENKLSEKQYGKAINMHISQAFLKEFAKEYFDSLLSKGLGESYLDIRYKVYELLKKHNKI